MAVSKKLVKLIKVPDGLHCPVHNRAVWNIFLYFVTLSFKYNHSLYVSCGCLFRAYNFFPHIFISVFFFFSNTEKQLFILIWSMQHATSLKQENMLWNQIPSTIQPVHKQKNWEKKCFTLWALLQETQRGPHNYYFMWGFSCTLSHIIRQITKSHRTWNLVMSHIFSITIRARKGSNLHDSNR